MTAHRFNACSTFSLSRSLKYACAALLLVACSKEAPGPDKKGAPGASGPPPALPVTVHRVELQRVPIVLEAVGQAEGSREVEVRARVSGILEKRLYTEGAPVSAGSTLFHIDRAQYEIAVAQARATLAQERARQEQAQREAERLKSLAASKAISQREFEEAVSQQKQSAAAIEGAQAKLAEAQLNLSYTRVKAPIGGITSRAVKSEGSLVAANTDLLTTLTQVNPIWLRFSLAESDFERIRGAEKRTRVQMLNQDGSVAADNGRVNFSGSTVDPKLGTVQLRAEFLNPTLKWLPGQFVKVHILAGEQNAFVVPQSAVVQTEQARMVWIAEADGKANMRPIQTASWVGSDWVVTGGLKPGDAVIVDNLMKMRPGAPVQPHAPGAGPQAPPAAAPGGEAGADAKAAKSSR
ncbi:MAG TPA: efflux RND transporter periplasmic adaptor subunit [Burkholderiales bacterium]|nr:efflux RND transporter periplasmic adaptor subunit [Burkholderiales bacterium]